MNKSMQLIGGFIIVGAMLLVLLHLLTSVAEAPATLSDSPVETGADAPVTTAAEFQSRLEEAVRIEIGQPIEGYEPAMFMQVFPGLEPRDFDGVEAQIGGYVYESGELRYEPGDTELLHSAAQAVTAAGVATVLENVTDRLSLPTDASVDEVVVLLQEGELGNGLGSDVMQAPDVVACTMDAKQCPDGSFVGRIGPDCAFAACPSEAAESEPEVVVCTDEMKQSQMCTREYRPVCGLVEVQCITTPCDPVPETFSNGCSACAQGNVVSYTAGACE